MNKIIVFLIVVALGISSSFSQNDYATLNIYNPKRICAGCKFNIYINDVFVTSFKNGGQLEYKIFKVGVTKITVIDNTNYTSSATLNIKPNGNYYVSFIKRAPIKRSRIDIEILDKPIIEKKLRPDRFISMSDVGVLDNNNSRKPDTDWTEVKLKEYWSEFGTKDIEGIYEKVSTTLEYELAVLKEKNEYKIIYLDGAKGTSWNEGDIKATLNKTAQFGIFKANWYMLNKAFNNDVIITFENATMQFLSENKVDKEIYLKIYPSYDEESKIPISEWKSSGTAFFIDKNGYLVTNYHVIEEAKAIEIDITKNGEHSTYKAEIVQVDKQNDLAILKINDANFNPLTSINYNFNTNTKDVGSTVFALGYPLTQIMGNEVKFTDGKISSKSGFQGDITTYQISVPIQPGNSGGPLFDEQGNLVGVTSSGIDRQLADNANYAVKTSYLKLLIDSIDDKLELPSSSGIENLSLTEQIKAISEYVVLIRMK